MENLPYYMSMSMTFAYQHKDALTSVEWPVGRLGDVLVHFRHSKTFEEGFADWERRKRRINYDNIMAVMYTEKLEVAQRFDKLPYEKKTVFLPFGSSIKSVHFLKIMKNRELSNIQIWDVVNKMAEGYLKDYDVLDFLLGHDNHKRIE